MQANILKDRDINTSSPTSPTKSQGADKVKSMDYHRQALDRKMKENEGQQAAYISPSDAIMSPASQKLSSFKQKQLNKQSMPKPRSLFAKTMTSRQKDLGEVPHADKGDGSS